ncbi:MAG: hypothetical protein K2H86_08780 [Muribaculaceae bacterium]|nr:hypothetical protein [Muribaculaceae bacterium]
MLKKCLMSACALICTALLGSAQVTSTPAILQEDSEGVTIYYHADQGNKALANLPASTILYAHTGVLTSESKSDSDWKFDPTWGDNSPKYEMVYVEPNLYKLYIGNIREYYEITDPNISIKKLCFVFRTADKDSNKQGKTESGGDILVNVMDSGLQIMLESSLSSNIITPDVATVNFTLSSTQPADLWISINGNKVIEKENATQLEYTYVFTEPGSYRVYGNAKQGETIKSSGMTLTYVKPSPAVDYPGGVPRQGAVRNADGTVTFCLAAPEKRTAILVGSWNDYDESDEYTMNVQDYNGQRYFWYTVSGLDETSMYPYYYLVDGSLRVGDPYAKLVLDPYNDKYISSSVYPNLPAYPTDKVSGKVMLGIYQENINDFNWTDDNFVRPDKDNLVIYEMLIRDFTGTEGKARGNGNIKTALEKLPYLKELGINVIELLPINEFNGNVSWGYNPNFYFAPDKAYGTPDDYKNFINTCHENGIAVVLDMVFNQSDGLHPWYQMYMPGQNPFYNLDAPHDWSVLNDWNQGHPLVRQQWEDCVKYWLTEYHVDGYRFDLVKGLGDNDSYMNNGVSSTDAYNPSRIANMRRIQKAMEEITPNAYFINEALLGAQEENEMAKTGMMNWANVNHQGGQYAKGYSSNSNLNRFYAIKDSRTYGSTVSYLESHDEQRLAYEQKTYGVAAVKDDHAVAMRRLGSAAAQMIMMPGSHMIWQFSEMGNDQSTKSSDGGNNTDPKKVNWALLDDPDNAGLVQNYRDLIRIRLANPDLFTQANCNVMCSTWSSVRYIKASDGNKELVCVMNPQTSKELTYNYSFQGTSNDNYDIVSKSYGTNPSFSVAAGTITVPANSYVLIVSKAVNSVDEIAADEVSQLYVRGFKGGLTVENAPLGYAIYSLNGTLIAQSDDIKGEYDLAPGIYIVKSGNEVVKIAVM